VSPPADSPPAERPGVSPVRADHHSQAIRRSKYPALGDARSLARFWITAIAGLALDLCSKEWAFHTLKQGGRRPLIPYALEFQTMLNDGALFGIGSGRTGLFLAASLLALALVLWMFAQCPPRRWLLQVALGAVLAGALGNMYDRMFVKLVAQPVASPQRQLIYLQVIGEEQGRFKLGEYPVEPGGFTRTTDRLPPLAGFVRDFIKIPTTVPNWGWVPAAIRGRELWPWVFNVADALLVCGVAVLAVHLWRDRRPRESPVEIAVDSPEGSA
jgi:signal peptidase II